MRMSFIGAVALTGLWASVADARSTPSLVLADEHGAAPIWIAPGEGEPVRVAADDLARDIRGVTGRTPRILRDGAPPCPGLWIATATNPAAAVAFAAAGSDPRLLAGRWEAFAIRPSGGLLVAGSDERGTVFAIYETARRYFGVDPIANWTGLAPARRKRIEVDDTGVSERGPAFRFRGWFLNDEDLITGWHEASERRRLVHYYFHLPIAPDVYERVFESALRLRCNTIIPGSYIDLEAACDRRIVEAAQRRGLFVSQHHTQPLGVSAFCFRNYWHDRGREVEFSYTARPREMEEVWEHYARLWSRYPRVIWQLGLRGAADRAFWATDPGAPKTDAGRGALVSGAIARQWEIVRRATGGSPPATATLWAEGSALHAKGHLAFPGDLAVVFADEGATQEMQADFRDIPRVAGRGYGVYYHAAFWGAGPRLVQGVALEKIGRNYAGIAAKGDTWISMLNVGSIREVILQAEAVADITWSGEAWEASEFLSRWCAREFGETNAAEAARLYRALFDAFPPSGASSGALLLDGVVRFAGKGLLDKALDRDAYPAYAGREDLAKFLNRYEPLAAEAARSFRSVAAGGAALAPRIPDERRPFLMDNLIVQAETMAGLGDWLDNLCKGMRDFTALEVGRASRHAHAAADALGRVLVQRKRAEWGGWANWYRGDWRMNLPALHEDTIRLAARWTELAERECPPAPAAGPR